MEEHKSTADLPLLKEEMKAAVGIRSTRWRNKDKIR